MQREGSAQQLEEGTQRVTRVLRLVADRLGADQSIAEGPLDRRELVVCRERGLQELEEAVTFKTRSSGNRMANKPYSYS